MSRGSGKHFRCPSLIWPHVEPVLPPATLFVSTLTASAYAALQAPRDFLFHDLRFSPYKDSSIHKREKFFLCSTYFSRNSSIIESDACHMFHSENQCSTLRNNFTLAIRAPTILAPNLHENSGSRAPLIFLTTGPSSMPTLNSGQASFEEVGGGEMKRTQNQLV